MRAFAIVLKNNPISEYGYKELLRSHQEVKNDFPLVRYNATTPKEANEFFGRSTNRIRWTWPWSGEEIDILLGLKKKAYETKMPLARVACFLSHFNLWNKCANRNETIMILEHDAVFIQKYPKESIPSYGAVSINDPRGATRKSEVFHSALQNAKGSVIPCPYVDDDLLVPQGLPGNSAYIITPKFAKEVIKFIEDYGAWPNDATLCRQNFPGKLFCMSNYFTKIQGLRSTTTT